MTGKERILNAIAGKKSDKPPLAIHGWGLYKFAMQGIVSGYSGACIKAAREYS